MAFQGDFVVIPDPAPRPVDAKLGGPQALAPTMPGSLKPVLEILRPRLGILRLRREYKGYMTHRRYKMSLAAWWPPKGGRRIN